MNLERLRRLRIMFIDYGVCAECRNNEAWYICYKCGECGRKFDGGVMVDDGGTTEVDWGEE